jgi:hypothetical protein
VTSLEQLLTELVDNLPADAGSVAEGIKVAITTVEVILPIESRLNGGHFGACWPRGRWQSGFELPAGSLATRFERIA